MIKNVGPITKRELTWDEVLKRNDLIGGNIQTIKGGIVFCGPIGKIEEDGEFIRFTYPWCARMNGDKWEKHPVTTCSINKEVSPQDIGNGRVYFSYLSGSCTLFPRDHTNFDPNMVEGLPKAWERLLAMYPNLRFDRQIAYATLLAKGWIHVAAETLKLPEGCTLSDFLAKFKHDSSKEEFLWFYIEAVTGEKDVHNKVY